MHLLPTVLLRHIRPADTHYDWLLADPDDPHGRLWTLRCPDSSDHWHLPGRLLLTPLPAHRRLYLDYQGPISGGRGTVQRIDAGRFLPRLWTPDRRLIDLQLDRCRARVAFDRLHEHLWQARLTHPDQNQRGTAKNLGACRSGH